ncbi:MAG: discoidin domain-containing protein [Myxococcota bacterium]
MNLNGNTESLPGVANEGAAPGSPPPDAETNVADPPAAAAKPGHERALDLRWAASERSERALGLERAARLALELADQALRPARKKQAPAPALAADLYRQSIACSLRALALVPASETELANALDVDTAAPAELSTLLESADSALLIQAAGSEERARSLSSMLSLGTFRSFAAMDAAELTQLGPELSSFAHELLSTVEERQWRIERPGAFRWLKIGGLSVLAIGLTLALIFGPEKWEASRDLAAGKPWRTSSTYQGGCESPAQDCPAATAFFAHTLEEENPWIEFDLGSLQTISGVHVTNRTDCCLERALPLVASVSSDQKTWKEVARTTQKFSDWKASFPAVQARWVRFEIPKRTNLHLRRVRILP